MIIQKDINFFSSYETKKKEKKNQDIYVYTIVGFLTAVIVGTLTYNSVKIFMIKKEIQAIEAKLSEPTLAVQLKEANEINEKISILEKYHSGLVTIVSAVEDRELINNTILDKISSVLPTDVTFKSINITSGNLSISASSKTRTAIAEVQHNLKNLDIVGDVVIGGISGDGSSGEFTFDLRCVLMGE